MTSSGLKAGPFGQGSLGGRAGPGKFGEASMDTPYSQQPGGRRGPVRVLVADGFPDTARVLALVLRRLGAEVVYATDGQEALRLAVEFRPAVVLMDLELPGMDGCQVARRLRQEAGSAEPLLVAVTGYQDAVHRRRAREAGFDHYLLKPASMGELRALVASAAVATVAPQWTLCAGMQGCRRRRTD